jgi:hypothetical protein
MSLAFIRTALARAQGSMLAVQEFAPNSTIASGVVEECGEALKMVDAVSTRIHELETALNRMALAHENSQEESDGRWPRPDSGCVYCTHNTTPLKFDTGPCAYHTAKKLLGQL